MRKEAQFFCHQVKPPRYYEVGVVLPATQGKSSTENFAISNQDGFVALIHNDATSTMVTEARLNLVTFVLEHFADYLGDYPDFEVTSIETKRENPTTIQFTVVYVLNEKTEEIIFEFQDNSDRYHIVFATKHHSLETTQIALYTVVDYLMTQLNTTFTLN